MHLPPPPALLISVDNQSWQAAADNYLRLARDRGACDLVHPMTRWGARADEGWPPGPWLDGDRLRQGWKPGGRDPHGQAVLAREVAIVIAGQHHLYRPVSQHVLGCLLDDVLWPRIYLVLYPSLGLSVREAVPGPSMRLTKHIRQR